MPTTVQVFWPDRTWLPSVSPWNWTLAPRPTTISLVPNSSIRPSTIEALSRTASVCGPMPRIGTLAAVPVLILGRSMMT